MSVDEYFTKLMGLYDELYRLKPLHACTCGLCTCNVVAKFAKDREEEQLYQFLISIDDEIYGTVRSNLLSQTPLPDISRAHQSFLQEERSRAIARGKSVAANSHDHHAALQADPPKGRPDKHERTKLQCSHCKQRGHEVGNCFKLHGYPEWWEDRNRTKGTTGATTSHGGGASAHAVAPILAPAKSSSGIADADDNRLLTTHHVSTHD
ncbi:unnamed protein product [Cuscuta epithymum]|uniref:Uncharacterized protein n=1 Tax=Cuscuta epithymum TaxID=186058 RepID=A0AAV0DR85_9ASTE|nr:unnamed protein product [Cuscuta epithymum]